MTAVAPGPAPARRRLDRPRPRPRDARRARGAAGGRRPGGAGPALRRPPGLRHRGPARGDGGGADAHEPPGRAPVGGRHLAIPAGPQPARPSAGWWSPTTRATARRGSPPTAPRCWPPTASARPAHRGGGADAGRRLRDPRAGRGGGARRDRQPQPRRRQRPEALRRRRGPDRPAGRRPGRRRHRRGRGRRARRGGRPPGAGRRRRPRGARPPTGPPPSARVPPAAAPLRVATTAMHGVGGALLADLLAAAGHADVHAVTAQERPDPDFPTVAVPQSRGARRDRPARGADARARGGDRPGARPGRRPASRRSSRGRTAGRGG